MDDFWNAFKSNTGDIASYTPEQLVLLAAYKMALKPQKSGPKPAFA